MVKTMAIILSMLMAVQTPVMAEELLAEEVSPQVEIALSAEPMLDDNTDDVILEENSPEEVLFDDEEEVVITEEAADIELAEEESEEDSLVSEEALEEDLAEEPVESITEELTAEEIDTVHSEEEIIEEDDLSLAGASSGQCGDNVFWTLSNDGVLTISGTGDMYAYDFDSGAPWFNKRHKISSIIIEPGVTSIGDYAFHDCSSSLMSVTIGDSVSSIGDFAFVFCASLESVTIPESVTSIGDYAFEFCDALTSVTISESVTSIGDGAFRCCSALTNVTIPDNVTSIGRESFYECTSLTSVTIPDSVTNIGDEAFYFCTCLSSVAIGNSVTSIGDYAFESCTSLTSVMIPDSVTGIGDYAFKFCVSLASVTVGNSVTTIGNTAFSDCESLNTIVFEGNAPQFDHNPDYYNESDAFCNVTATAYYPVDNSTWTKDVMRDYGGNITWIPLRSNGKPCFSDVINPDDFFYDPIYRAVDKGITTGYSDNTFRPNSFCHRAAVVAFLWRMAGKPDEGISTAFSDMTGNDDFDRAITWASNHGITTGYDDGTFRPYNPCHRVAIVTFLWRYANKPEPTFAAGFSDMTNNAEFDKAIAWAAENNITTGYTDGTFRPYNSCLRLAVVTFLYRYAHF